MSLGIFESWCMHMTSLQWGDQDAMAGLDTVLRQRYELNEDCWTAEH